MRELAAFHEIQREHRLPRPLQIWLMSPSLQRRCVFWGLVVLAAEAWLVMELMNAGLTLASLAQFLVPQVFVLVPGVRAGLKALRKAATVLEFGDRRLLIRGQDGAKEEVPYADITGFWQYAQGDAWVRIERHDGRVREIPRNEVQWAGATTETLVSHLGPRVGPHVVKGRLPRPTDPVEGRAWDFFGDPPGVAMVPGRRYRYLDRGYLRREAMKRGGSLPNCVAPTVVFVILAARTMEPGLLLGAGATVTAWVMAVVLSLWKAWRLWRAADDQFEAVPEGLKITRRGRSWVVRDPRKAKGLLHGMGTFGRPFVRFGSYLFDPRFLEEDRP